MPSVRRFDRFTIYVYGDDQAPPHFHVVERGFKAIVRLSDLGIDRGTLPRGVYAEAAAWAANLETPRRPGAGSMSETDLITAGDPLPTLAGVAGAGEPYAVAVSWAAGSRAGRTDTIGLAPIILTLEAFRPLRDDPPLFASVRLGPYADAIEWGPGDALAMSGATLERLAEETMTSADLAAFMARHGLSYDAAAAHLGISRRLVAYYLQTLAIPRTVALACKYLDGALGRTEAA